jgi:hypothetical protein
MRQPFDRIPGRPGGRDAGVWSRPSALEVEGRLRLERSAATNACTLDEVTRLLADRRRASVERPIVAVSAQPFRIVTGSSAIPSRRLSRSWPARIVVSLMTAGDDELGLREAIGVVKATNVIVEVPSSRESRG